MAPLRSDAFVFFGATGDLAFKKIFPALQALFAGGLELPVVGMARANWTLDRLRERARESVESRSASVLTHSSPPCWWTASRSSRCCST